MRKPIMKHATNEKKNPVLKYLLSYLLLSNNLYFTELIYAKLFKLLVF